jgi:hypothetical protein
MTALVRNGLLAGVVLALGGAAAPAQQPGVPLTKDQAAKAYAAATDMINALYYLQDTIADHPVPEQKRGLYAQAGGVVADLMTYKKFILTQAPRGDLYFEYTKVETKLHALLDLIDSLGPADQAIKRSAEKVRAADSELHLALSAGDGSDARARQVLQRQSRSLLAATRALQRVEPFAAGNRPGLADALKGLTQATEKFDKLANGKADLAALKDGFADVVRAWEPAAALLNKLPFQQTLHLMSQSVQVDNLEDRVFLLLKMPGNRTRINFGF